VNAYHLEIIQLATRVCGVWCVVRGVVLQYETNEVAVGDDGVVVLQLGQGDPSYSIDPLANSCRIPLTTREPGSLEMYANATVHSNGIRYCHWTRRAYQLYCPRVLAWRNKAFGPGTYVCPAGRQVGDINSVREERNDKAGNRTQALRETYVVNFTKVKLSRSCGGFVVVLWWSCGEVVVKLW